MQNASSKSQTGKFRKFAKNKTPDIDQIEDSPANAEALSNSFYRVSPVLLLLTRLATNKYRYVSPSFKRVLGYPSEMILEKGPEFFHSLHDPIEWDFYNFVHNEINVYNNLLSPEDKLNCLYKYGIKLCRSDGRYVSLLCQLQFQENDSWNHPLYAVETFTDITHFAEGYHRNLIIEKIDQNSTFTEAVYNYVSNEKENKLTNRELEIYRLIKKGNTSKEIAEELNISKSTIDTHRRNINEKFKNGNEILFPIDHFEHS